MEGRWRKKGRQARPVNLIIASFPREFVVREGFKGD